MQMTESEIVRSYREAKNKRNQIEVLADLNTCTPDDIRAILKNNGVDLRGGSFKKKVTKEDAPEEKAAVTKPESIEIPEEQLKENNSPGICMDEMKDPVMILPRIVRKTLEEELSLIEEQLHELIEKRITIKTFLEDTK